MGSFMIIVFASCVTVLVAVLGWCVQSWLGRGYQRYRSTFKKEAHARLSEFFVFLDPTQLWGAAVLLCCALMIAAYFISGMLAVAAAVGILALLSPRYVVARLRRRRLAQFDEQLPDLLLALAGAMRAGSGMQAALRHIVSQAPTPLAQEFGLMLRQQRMGVSFEAALGDLYERMPTEGASLVVSSLKIASQNGGGLAETLDAIAGTLRARLQLLGRIRALTAQGRMQAWVMAGLPFVLALALSYLDPQSMAALWSSMTGWAVLGAIVILELAGVLFIRRIVNIEV